MLQLVPLHFVVASQVLALDVVINPRRTDQKQNAGRTDGEGFPPSVIKTWAARYKQAYGDLASIKDPISKYFVVQAGIKQNDP